MKPLRVLSLTLGLLLIGATLASAEILALINYESKADQPVRREGIAIMDIDRDSADFGKIPLPLDLVAHHIILGSIDTLKTHGFNPNCIMLLPNHFQPGGLRADLVAQ